MMLKYYEVNNKNIIRLHIIAQNNNEYSIRFKKKHICFEKFSN